MATTVHNKNSMFILFEIEANSRFFTMSTLIRALRTHAYIFISKHSQKVELNYDILSCDLILATGLVGPVWDVVQLPYQFS